MPQSPQLFKQLLMMSDFNRYQIVKCFRDKDLRANRQPEFTQIDVETSFITAAQVREVMMERLVRDLWRDITGVDLGVFPRMTYADAMRRFGSDRPDLLNPMKLGDVANLVKDVAFNVFSAPANDAKGSMAALRVPGGAPLSRKQIDEYGKYIEIYAAKGLAWMKVNQRDAGAEGVQSPVARFMGPQVIEQMLARTGAADGDIIFLGVDRKNVVTDALGALRLKLGLDLRLTETDRWAPLWVVDFPMFEEEDQDGRPSRNTSSLHRAPKEIDAQTLAACPTAAVANAYDMVINGYEVGGDSGVSTTAICSRPCSAFWVSMNKNSRRSSVFCSMH